MDARQRSPGPTARLGCLACAELRLVFAARGSLASSMSLARSALQVLVPPRLAWRHHWLAAGARPAGGCRHLQEVAPKPFSASAPLANWAGCWARQELAACGCWPARARRRRPPRPPPRRPPRRAAPDGPPRSRPRPRPCPAAGPAAWSRIRPGRR